MTPPGPKARWSIGLVITALASAIAVTSASRNVVSPAQAVADAAPPAPSLVTAEVELRDLREPIVFRGTIDRAPGHLVDPPAAPEGAAQIVTATPHPPGEPIAEGEVAIEVAGRPVFVLQGQFPAYRDLTPGSTGPDIEQLQGALVRLGYPLTVDGTFGPETQDQLEGFYQDRGYVPLAADPSARTQLGSAATAVRAAERSVEAARRAKAQAQIDLDNAKQDGENIAPAENALRDASDQLEAGTETVADARRMLEELGLAAGGGMPRSEVLFIDRLPRTVSTINASMGSNLSDLAEPLLDMDAPATDIVVTVPPSALTQISVGAPAEALDSLDGTVFELQVKSIGTDSEIDQEEGIEVRLESSSALPVVEGRSLQVTIEGQTLDGPVLVVPITGIFSRPDGTTYLTVVDNDGNRDDLDVVVGAVIGGFAEVAEGSSPDIRQGSSVIVGIENLTPTTE